MHCWKIYRIFPLKSEDFFQWVRNFKPLEAIQGRCILILNDINQLISDF